MSLDKLVNALLPDPINLEVIKEMLDECVVKLPIAYKCIFRGLPSVEMYSLPSTTSNIIMVVAVCSVRVRPASIRDVSVARAGPLPSSTGQLLPLDAGA